MWIEYKEEDDKWTTEQNDMVQMREQR
jgi:hypothetical protein